MNKISNTILNNISENNNEYRNILSELKLKIEEKTSSIIGDIVTASNYVVDFSKTVSSSKEKLTNLISKTVESYAIKDLRNVEDVNEQFFEKINDKIENANLKNEVEIKDFISNLDLLLNDKYLEIIKIKRINFFDEQMQNQEIEEIIKEYEKYIANTYNYSSDKITKILNDYKSNIYQLIKEYLEKISSLYLNNFKDEIVRALSSVEESAKEEIENNTSMDSYTSAIPEIPNIPEIEIPEIPEINVEEAKEEINLTIPEVESNLNTEEVAVVEPSILDIPEIPSIKVEEKPLVVEENVQEENADEENKKKYDVEEILKIAKSPVLTMPVEENKKEDNYISVKPIKREKEIEITESEFNEKEIVEELINRLKIRIKNIDERQAKYDVDKKQIEEDEAFVNDLILSSNAKKDELNALEEELNSKEKELDAKQKELEKKINDVMPFASAILNNN